MSAFVDFINYLKISYGEGNMEWATKFLQKFAFVELFFASTQKTCKIIDPNWVFHYYDNERINVIIQNKNTVNVIEHHIQWRIYIGARRDYSFRLHLSWGPHVRGCIFFTLKFFVISWLRLTNFSSSRSILI